MSMEAGKHVKKIKAELSTTQQEKPVVMNVDLPFDLIESNILPRLSAKFVGRCMCVCKQWRSFLSAPTFVRTHLQHVTINDYKLLLLNYHRLPATFRTVTHGVSRTTCHNPNPDLSATRCILASLDGLVCLATREEPTKLAFLNPLTGVYKMLSPNPYYVDFCWSTDNDSICFYIDSSNDYKLLCLFSRGRKGAYIYSNKLDSWRKIEFSTRTYRAFNPKRAPGTFWGNCVYFICWYIICFDVNTETFRRISLPPEESHGTLEVLNGCIHFVSHKKLTSTLWRMDGDDGWVKKVAANKKFTKQHICTSTGIVYEEKTYPTKNKSWKHRSRMMYVETLVSPNP